MVEDIGAEELYVKLDADDGTPQVVDVRSEAAFQGGHLPGAENVPYHRFTALVDEIEWETEIVLVCPHGESSRQAGRLLEAYEGVTADAEILNLAEGYAGWPYDLETPDQESKAPF